MGKSDSCGQPDLKVVLRHGRRQLENQYGYWAEDDETGESGFLQAFDNAFWTFDDEAEAWAVRRFQGRKVRRGAPKGKARGKDKAGKDTATSGGRAVEKETKERQDSLQFT